METLDVVEAVFTTRSMRRLKPDPVPDQVIWEVLDAAIRGPSSGNVQRWGWIVVTDADTKAQIATWYLDAWNALGGGRKAKLKQYALRLSRLGREPAAAPAADEDRNTRSGRHLAHHLAAAPVWIVAVQRGVKDDPTFVDGADIFGAIQNLMLVARKHGLGSTLTMLHRARERDVAGLLGLPADAKTIALIPIGYPRSKFSTPVRKPVETVTHWERWGATRRRPATRAESPMTERVVEAN
jgi:nitroreductase